jgi:hypothetical protein
VVVEVDELGFGHVVAAGVYRRRSIIRSVALGAPGILPL